MFGNALFHPSNTPSPGRRYSHLDVSLAPKISQRRSTAPFIDVAGMSPGLGTMMGDYNGGRPSTPCFVTPTLGGFSGRRFSYDSPMQTLTAFSRGGLPTVNRKAAKRAWARMNTKKWSRPCKMVTILLLITFAVTLFLVRKMKERPLHMQHESCNDDTGTCQVPDAHIHENDPKGEFMELVSQNEHLHNVEEEPSDLWINRWTIQETEDVEEIYDRSQTSEGAAPNESEVNVVEQEPLGYEDLQAKVLDYVESVKTFIGDKITASDSQQEEAGLTDIGEDVPEHNVESDPGETTYESSQDLPLKVAVDVNPSHVHVLNGATSYHTNDHSHAVPEPEMWPMQGSAQVEQAQMKPELQPQFGSMHKSTHQAPAGHLQVPYPGLPSNMQQSQQSGPSQPLQPHRQVPVTQHQIYQNQGAIHGMPPHPSGQLRPPQIIGGGPRAPGMPQQHHAHIQHQGMRPPPGHGVAPGVNLGPYNQQYPQPHNQQYQQPQFNHNQGHIIGHSPPHHNGYQKNHGQRLPPGVNPNKYMGL